MEKLPAELRLKIFRLVLHSECSLVQVKEGSREVGTAEKYVSLTADIMYDC